MTVWLAGSRSATAARMATVLPVPTSPVTMQMVLSATAQVMRAAASPQSRWRCSREGGRSRPNGMRASPNRVTTASITGVLLFLFLLFLLFLLLLLLLLFLLFLLFLLLL